MFWESFALTVIGSGLDALFGTGGGMSKEELRAALADAVDEIKQDFRQATLENRLNELQAAIFALDTVLRDYVDSGDRALLELLTDDSAKVCSDLQMVSDPEVPLLTGLPGHTLFMVAAGLRIQILQKRVEVGGSGEPGLLKRQLDGSVIHAELMHLCWDAWNWAQFVGPYTTHEPVSPPLLRFCYRYQKKEKRTDITVPWDPTGLFYTGAYNTAKKRRRPSWTLTEPRRGQICELVSSRRPSRWYQRGMNCDSGFSRMR